MLEAVEQLREDFREDRQAARESRNSLHRRLDEQAVEVARLRSDVMVSGEIDAMVRNELKDLRDTINENHNSIQPDIEEFRRMRTLGRGLVWLLGFGGMSLGAAIAYTSEHLASVVRHWLKIG